MQEDSLTGRMMADYFTLPSLIIIAAYLFRLKSDCWGVKSGSPLEEGSDYLKRSLKDVPVAVVDQPDNRNSSIKYLMYSPKTPRQACFLEPTEEALKNCPVDPQFPMVFLIHGFVTELNPGNLFEVMKDLLMKNEQCTVIIVDWSKYDGPPYELAIRNVMVIGSKVADLIKYLMKNSGISKDNIIIVGHSLGAHMAGAIGKHLPGLSRIDGLDPAGPYFETKLSSRLSYADANFVKVVHTSNEIYGLGLEDAIGHIDVYVNGGERQPHCHYGKRFRSASGDEVTVNNPIAKRSCHHGMVLIYYAYSINSTDCDFLATNCGSFGDFKKGKCPPENSAVADMGFYGQSIPGLPERSKFYLRPSIDPPYCIKNGYKSL